MKKTANLIVKTFCSLLVVGLASCKEIREDKPEKEHEENKEMEAQEITYEAPKQIISLEKADSLYLNYKNRRVKIIEKMEAGSQTDRKPFVPTQFVSFDIKVLKDYIGYVEQEAKKGGTAADSIRIYLGNYGSTSKKYERKNTVFLLPTAEVDGQYGGIFIDTDGKAKLVTDWKAQMTKGMGLLENDSKKAYAGFGLEIFSAPSLQTSGTSLTLNHGGSGPPPRTDF